MEQVSNDAYFHHDPDVLVVSGSLKAIGGDSSRRLISHHFHDSRLVTDTDSRQPVLLYQVPTLVPILEADADRIRILGRVKRRIERSKINITRDKGSQC